MSPVQAGILESFSPRNHPLPSSTWIGFPVNDYPSQPSDIESFIRSLYKFFGMVDLDRVHLIKSFYFLLSFNIESIHSIDFDFVQLISFSDS